MSKKFRNSRIRVTQKNKKLSTDLQQHLYPIDIYKDNYQKNFRLIGAYLGVAQTSSQKWPKYTQIGR